MPLQKLTKTNPDRIFLKSLFESGKLTEADRWSDVREAHARFKQYQKKNFRTCYVNTLAEVQAAVKEKNNGKYSVLLIDPYYLHYSTSLTATIANEIIALSTEDRAMRSSKSNVKVDSDSSDGEEIDTDDDTVRVNCCPTTFTPLYFMFPWQETLSTRQRLSIVISLPSGTNDTYGLCVVRNGMALQLRVLLPSDMVNVQLLHSLWLNNPSHPMSRDHPKIGACVQALKERKESLDASVPSFSTIQLPLKVETDLSYEAIHLGHATYLLYVDLKAASDVYSGTAERKPFQRVSSGSPSSPTRLFISPTTPAPAGGRGREGGQSGTE